MGWGCLWLIDASYAHAARLTARPPITASNTGRGAIAALLSRPRRRIRVRSIATPTTVYYGNA